MSTYRVVPLSSLSAPSGPLRNQMDQGQLEELARSIQLVGLLQPLTVKETENGYEVVAGHRRLMACRMCGLAEVAVMIREAEDEQQAAVMMSENLQRADLTPIEEARALRQMVDVLGYAIEKCAHATSRSEAWVRGRLELLTWPMVAVNAIAEGRASVASLKPLMDIEDATERDRLLACAIDAGATAAVTRVWAQQAQGFASPSTEGLSGRSAAMVGIGDVVVSMPCYSCRETKDAFSLQVLRVCRPCIAELESAASQPAPAQRVDA